MNSRRRLADVCGSHKKCCDLQLGFSSSFCELKDIQLNVWIGSPVTVDPSRLPSWKNKLYCKCLVTSLLEF